MSRFCRINQFYLVAAFLRGEGKQKNIGFSSKERKETDKAEEKERKC